MTNQLFGLEFCAVRQDTFYLRQDYDQIIFYKSRVFFSLVGPSETANSQFIYNWLYIGKCQPKIDNISFFYQHSQPLYDVMQKEIENF